MSVSRRRFLKHGTFAAIACAAIPSQAFSGRKHDLDGGLDLGRDPKTHQNLSRSVFEGLIGSSFKVTDKSGNSVWLRLTAVEDLSPVAPV
ncbi:MAG TPA: twin-arginine translocation signal domain-containing protein, partial [Candidatus Angelobacter sp.]|nr:twin-arginine translocation signal domain-containing protein [Candidatus Angelobacter sp.]